MRGSYCTHWEVCGGLSNCMKCAHLEVVVFVGVCREQVFGALDVIGQLRLCQVSPKAL